MTARAAKRAKAETTEVVRAYEPTDRERAALSAYRERRAATRPAPRIKVTHKGDRTELGPDHPDGRVASTLLMGAVGTADFDFLDGLLAQLANAGARGSKADEQNLNFMLSVIKGIEPKDEIEAMLAAQMAAVHMAMMTFTRRLAGVETIQQQDSAERAFNKLARTFTAQVEALKRYRTGGEQRVTVEHVTVNEGGQAIVGSVSPAPRGGRTQRNPETTP
jgi:hypothetical protein